MEVQRLLITVSGGQARIIRIREPELQTRNDFWESNPVLDTWTRIEDFPTSPRFGACAAVVGSVAYIIGGYGGIYEQDLWFFLPR